MNSFNCWVIFHGVYVPQLPYPFVCWWASRLLPCPDYYKQCCDEHWGALVSFRPGFLGVYAQKWDCWVIWQFYFQFKLVWENAFFRMENDICVIYFNTICKAVISVINGKSPRMPCTIVYPNYYIYIWSCFLNIYDWYILLWKNLNQVPTLNNMKRLAFIDGKNYKLCMWATQKSFNNLFKC